MEVLRGRRTLTKSTTARIFLQGAVPPFENLCAATVIVLSKVEATCTVFTRVWIAHINVILERCFCASGVFLVMFIYLAVDSGVSRWTRTRVGVEKVVALTAMKTRRTGAFIHLVLAFGACETIDTRAIEAFHHVLHNMGNKTRLQL
jgi:hypothetical protein